MNSTQSSSRLSRFSRRGLLNALSHPHDIDRYLEAINPAWSLNEIRAVVKAVRYETADSVTLTLKPNRNWQGFRPGQFVQLSVPVDGVRKTRCYSPANSVHAADGNIELTIKAHPWGTVSRHLRQHATIGLQVTLSPAQGDFHLPEQRPERLLLISGGSGITPVMSMLRSLIDEDYRGRISFLHYALSADDAIYREALEAIAAEHPNVELIRVYTDQPAGAEATGLFSDAQIAELVPDFADAETFLCGPPALMSAVEAHWQNCGISDRLHLERFTAAGATAATDSDTGGDIRGDVSFVRSERYVPNDGRNLLDQAEAAGLTPESGCRMGICSTCSCRKTSGSVKNLITGAISSEANEDIRICVSVAIGDVQLEL